LRSPVGGFSTKKNLITGDLVDTLAVMRRFDLTDGQWAVLEPLLPKAIKPGRPSSWSRRQLVDGIRWRVRVGAPWRDLPAEYGSWQAVYGLFRRWQRDGTWAGVLTALQALADAGGHIVWDVSVDSTIARAHQHAAGARKRGICRPNQPAASVSSPTITRWVAPGAA
jgi:transposase